MRLKVLADHEALSRWCAARILKHLHRDPRLLLCTASGSTPRRAFQLLAEQCEHDLKNSQDLQVIQLDEWGGLPLDDPATCRRDLQESLADPLQLGARFVAFASEPGDPNLECARVGDWLKTHGPIGLCVLGLGLNGHVGFNEPATQLQPHAHIAELSSTSLRHSMLARSERRPTYGLTLGIVDLLHARDILLLVSGDHKQEPLRQMLEGPISTNFPASLLRLHRRLIVACTRDAMRSSILPLEFSL